MHSLGVPIQITDMCLGLARIIYTYGVYMVCLAGKSPNGQSIRCIYMYIYACIQCFWQEITKCTAIYGHIGEHVPFWPTLHVRKHTLVGKCVTLWLGNVSCVISKTACRRLCVLCMYTVLANPARDMSMVVCATQPYGCLSLI